MERKKVKRKKERK